MKTMFCIGKWGEFSTIFPFKEDIKFTTTALNLKAGISLTNSKIEVIAKSLAQNPSLKESLQELVISDTGLSKSKVSDYFKEAGFKISKIYAN